MATAKPNEVAVLQRRIEPGQVVGVHPSRQKLSLPGGGRGAVAKQPLEANLQVLQALAARRQVVQSGEEQGQRVQGQRLELGTLRRPVQSQQPLQVFGVANLQLRRALEERVDDDLALLQQELQGRIEGVLSQPDELGEARPLDHGVVPQQLAQQLGQTL